MVNARELPKDQSQRRVELWLNKTHDADPWRLTYSVLHEGRRRQRTDYRPAQRLGTSLAPGLAQALERYLARISDTSVHHDRDYALPLPGAHLNGLRLFSWRSEDGRMAALVVFPSIRGFASAVFGDPQLLEAGALPATDSAALRALDDLLVPALELYDQLVGGALGEADARVVAARLKTMCVKRDQLSHAIAGLQQVLARDGVLPATSETCAGGRQVTWTPELGWERSPEVDVLSSHHAEPRKAKRAETAPHLLSGA